MRQTIELNMPAWLAGAIEARPSDLSNDEAWMRFVVGLSAENVRRETGGPFAAAVVDAEHNLIAAGVNVVMPSHCAAAHGEVTALCLAQQTSKTHDLSTLPNQPITLYTSCEPCTMCLGATCWSGVKRVVCGATDADARGFGFNEGPKPDDVGAALAELGIAWSTGVCRDEAVEVLRTYAESGRIYNPGD